MRIIFITPNLSSGGMPEYLRKKVELLKDDNDVWVLELHTEWLYRVQRDKIESLIGDRLIPVNSNFEKMWGIIQEIKPDIIHFEELSDYNIPYEILDRIYTPDRKWKIFETFHDSSIESLEKRYLPDKLIVVSPWQQKMMMDLGIPIEVINHEIDTDVRDRDKLKELGLDPNKKHVMQVGIFSRRKNQSETFELARLMPDVQFHFLGGLAENYKYYWNPLIANKPDNCHIWNERNDVDRFYQCFDAVIFPSRGNYGDRETNPLVIRESIAWKIPLLVRDLPVYMGMYREGSLVKFMSDDINSNVETLSKITNIEKNKTKIMQIDESFFKKKLFNIKFNSSDNKIEFQYLGEVPISLKINVRDIDTEVPIYSFDANFSNGSSYWCIPIPKPNYDFNSNPNFGGFLYDFYDISGSKVYSQSTRIKRTDSIKPKFRIESFEPVFVNYEQFFTDKIYDKFFEKINKLDVVVDVGSNIGLFTELARTKGAKNIYSLEINQNSIKTFKDIHEKNKSVYLIEKGLSGNSGSQEIYIDPSNSLISSINKDHQNSFTNSTSVEMLSFTDFVKSFDIQNIDLIKIDVEGAEYEIFDSISEEDIKKLNYIILEFHDNFGGVLQGSIINKLNQFGFQYEIYQDDCVGIGNDYEERGTIFGYKSSQ